MSNLTQFFGSKGVHWPTPSSSVAGYWGGSGSIANQNFLPGFSNDDAAYSSIRINITTNYSFNMYYYNGTGTLIETGSWAGGLTASDFTGAAYILSAYMDAVDEKLYVMVQKTSTAPDEVAFAHINKAGLIVMYPYRSFSTATLDGNHSWGPLLRPGGDGSGDFISIAAGAGDAHPYRGKKYTIGVADGAMAEADWFTVGGQWTKKWYIGGQMGPTSNNIWGFPRTSHHAHQDTVQGHMRGALVNATTGMYILNALWPNDAWAPGGGSNGNGEINKIIGWRGRYGMVSQTGTGMRGWEFKKDECHTMMDQMAVQYGLL